MIDTPKKKEKKEKKKRLKKMVGQEENAANFLKLDIVWSITSLANNDILDLSKLVTFADNK